MGGLVEGRATWQSATVSQTTSELPPGSPVGGVLEAVPVSQASVSQHESTPDASASRWRASLFSRRGYPAATQAGECRAGTCQCQIVRDGAHVRALLGGLARSGRGAGRPRKAGEDRMVASFLATKRSEGRAGVGDFAEEEARSARSTSKDGVA